MNGKQLKNSILQWAIQGKLVPQDSNDEPASVLLDKIRAEKMRLVKEKKIKKDKNESIIYCGDDNSYYEKFVDGTVKCIDEEIPFDVPNGWEWCRMSNLMQLISGQDFAPDKYNSQHKGIPYITGASNIISNELEINRWTEAPSVIVYDGDLLIVCKGSGIGKMCVCNTKKAHIARQIQAIQVSSPYIQLQYLRINIEANLQVITSKAQGVIPGIGREHILNLLVPLPPSKEQNRLVAKMNQLMPLLKKYNSFYHDCSMFQAEFPDKLRKSILLEAIQGKLFTQDPNDEPAFILLERIKVEKQNLVQDGKPNKSALTDSIIYKGDDNKYYEQTGKNVVCIDNEIPFEIPESWCWRRLGCLIDFSKNSSAKAELISEESWILDLEDIEKGTGRLLRKKRMKDINSKSDKHIFHAGDILYSKLRPYLNKVIIADEDGFCTSEILAFDFGAIYNRYAQIFLMSPLFVEHAMSDAYGVKMPRIGSKQGNNALIPIPPVSEQKRIVTRIYRLMDRINA